MTRVPLTELPIRIFRAIDGSNDHVAHVHAGPIQFTCIAPSAIEAKRKMKAFIHEQTERAKGVRRKKEGGE